jgi:hypothetical protein
MGTFHYRLLEAAAAERRRRRLTKSLKVRLLWLGGLTGVGACHHSSEAF